METISHKKVIIVTGASQGLGKVLCKELVGAGHRVVGVARSTEKLENLNREINSPLFSFETCDVSNEQNVFELSKKIQPDAIICAAAINEADNTPYKQDVVRKTMEINFFGTMNFVNSFLPSFLQRGSGHFISISSISALKPNRRSVSYSASKAAIAMAFRGLEANKQKSPIHFSTVYLGPVNTEMWEGRKSWIVAEPEMVAQKLHKLIIRPRPVSYIPFTSTTLSRLSLLIPDSLYAKISKILFK